MTLSRNQVEPSDADIEAANDWLLRLTSGGATERDLADFEAWRDADNRHAAAFAEVRELWNDLAVLSPAAAWQGTTDMPGDVPGDMPAPAAIVGDRPRHQARRPRRGRMVLGGLMAACLALFVIFAGDIQTRFQADYRTGVGERTSFRLPDGTTAHLNTDSAIALTYTAERREIALLRGEALFEVTKDPARPFQVTALQGRSRALGTVFAVQSRDDSAVVTVVEGRVRVAAPAPEDGAAQPGRDVDLSGNQQVAYAAGGSPGAVRRVDAARLTAWRRGVVFIDGLPLAAALAEIDRYHPGRIVLLSGAGRGEPVTARIALDRIDSGIKALAATHGLTVTHLTDFLVVVR